MTEAFNKESRDRLVTFLPQALSKALTSYHQFMEQTIPEEAKEFSAYHGAAKVASSHVELLIKLAKSAELPKDDTKDDEQTSIMEMLARAEQEVHGFKHRQDLWEQEGEEDVT